MKEILPIIACMVVLTAAIDEGRYIPHLAFLQFNVQVQDGFTACSGVLISDNAILSTASCTDQGDGIRARLAVVELGIKKPWTHERPEYFFDSYNVTIHEEISIVHLAEKPILSKNIQPVQLPTTNLTLANGYVFGWEEQPWRTHAAPVKLESCGTAGKERLCSQSDEDICVARGSSFLANDNKTVVALTDSFNYVCHHPRAQSYIPIYKYVDWIKAHI